MHSKANSRHFFKSIDSGVLCKITYLPGLGAGP